MYELPSRDDVERVVIDADVVVDNVNPTLVPSTKAKLRSRPSQPRWRSRPNRWTSQRRSPGWTPISTTSGSMSGTGTSRAHVDGLSLDTDG